MKKLFLEIIRLCAEAGWVKLGQISLDGTKVKANAWLSVNRKLKHLRREIDKMLSKAEAKETEEDKAFDPDKPGDEMADDLRDRNSRKRPKPKNNNRTRLIKSYGQVARTAGIKKKAVFLQI